MRLRLWSLTAASLLWASTALAFHVPPWDTGHQSFDPDPGIQNTDPGSDSPCRHASPVEVSTGNLVQEMPLFRLSGLGPELDFTLVYNSQDLRKGPFGTGWTHQYDERVVTTTDGAQMFAIDCGGNGKRNRFSRAADGSYTPPPFTFLSLVRQPDSTSILRDKHGVVRTFDTDGKLLGITDRNGNVLALTYDPTGFLTAIADASGRTLKFTKGPSGRVASMTDPANHTFLYTYDASGNLTRIADPLGQAWAFQYNTAGMLATVIDPRGKTQMAILYDSNRRVQQLTERAETWTYSYQPGQTTKKDSGGNTWTLRFNAAGSITTKTDPLGKSESYTYDAQFDITSYTDQNGHTTLYTYDLLGNMLSMKDALGNVKSIAYEPTFSLPKVLTNAAGDATQLAYDSHGNLTSVTDPSGAITQLQYNAKGQLTQATDPLGGVTKLAYDAYGNVVSVTEPGKPAATATFDVLGQLLTATDPRGNAYQYAYDTAQRLVRTTNPAGDSVTRQYDASGNLTALVLPNNASFTFAYDDFNRLTRSSNPLQQATFYGYDRHDNVIVSTDAVSRQTVFSYDALDRLLTKRLPHDTVNYTYDSAGNLLSVANGTTMLSFAVDAANRLTRTTAQPQNATLTYAYDAAGRVTSISDGSGAIQYGYNHRSLVTSITDFDGFNAIMTYDANRRRTTLVRSGGFETQYGYDAANRLLSMTLTSPAGPLSFAYTYDDADNRVSMRDAAGTHTYGYNRRDYLTSATHPTSNNPAETYTYDSVGNRATSHLSAAYTYDLANRLTEDAQFDYFYDAAGNPTTRKNRSNGNVRSFVYDDENRLTQINFADGTTATYRYDGLGRRYEKTAGGQTTRYVYAGASILKEIDANGSTLARYTPGVQWDETLAVRRGGATNILETNGIGSIVRTASSGAATATFTYDAFGNIVALTGTPPAPYAFQGRAFDTESGLYYYLARYYDPRGGRFMTEDPNGLTDDANLYVFAASNPVTYTDPLGLWRWPDYVSIGGGFAFWSWSLTIDSYGNVYGSGSIGLEKGPLPERLQFGGGATANWLNQCNPTESDINKFVSGSSLSGSVGDVIGVTATLSHGKLAGGLGIMTPQIAGGYTQTRSLGRIPALDWSHFQPSTPTCSCSR